MARIVASGATTVVPSLAGMLAQLVGSLALLVIMAPQIAWMLIPAGIVFAGFTLGFRRVPKRLHKRIHETDGCARSHLIECLNSLLVVKSFQREDFAERGAAALLEDHRAACMRRNRFSNLCNIGFGLAMRAAYLVAAAYCAYGILEGSVNYGTFVAALQLVGQVQGPLANISGCVPRYFAMTASAERLMDAEALPSPMCPRVTTLWAVRCAKRSPSAIRKELPAICACGMRCVSYALILCGRCPRGLIRSWAKAVAAYRRGRFSAWP